MKLIGVFAKLWLTLPFVKGFSPASHSWSLSSSSAVRSSWPILQQSTVTGEEVDLFADGAITSTLAEGTDEADIILSWETDVADQIRHNLAQRHKQNDDQEGSVYVVGIVGNPGSGKTTSCSALSDLLSDVGCLVVPFDGYHYPMNTLQNMDNAEDLIYRRGAPDTFDATRLREDLVRIKHGVETSIGIPGFDHEAGDPMDSHHVFQRDQHKVVLCEGLYLLHDDETWRDTKDLLDYSIFVTADVDVCVERLKERNKAIPGYTEEEIEERVEKVDRQNALVVEKSQNRADLVVDSIAQRSMTTTIADGTPDSEVEISWEAAVAARIRDDLRQRGDDASDKPYMLSLVGGPGSGKTTSCHVLEEMLSEMGCVIMAFDGYHIPKDGLLRQPNGLDLLYRRGAPDTFDLVRLQKDLQRIRDGSEAVVSLPGFDHAHGDPEEGANEFVRGQHQVVMCEGLYLLHDQDGWESTRDLFDYSIFVDADVDKCIERVKIRNKCIPGYTEEEIEERCEVVDRVNAMTVDRSKKYADFVVQSVAM